MKRICIFLSLLLLCAISCNKDNGNGSASGTDSGAVVPQPDPDPDPDPTSEPAEIDFNNIDPQDPHYKDNRGSGHNVNGNRTGTISGTPWSLEQWAESSGQYSMTYYDNGNFKATWSNCSDYLARVGFKYNNSGIDPKTKNYIADYQFTKTGSASWGYIGAYGWTNDPIVEYYIVDDWYGSTGVPYGGQKKANLRRTERPMKFTQLPALHQPRLVVVLLLLPQFTVCAKAPVIKAASIFPSTLTSGQCRA